MRRRAGLVAAASLASSSVLRSVAQTSQRPRRIGTLVPWADSGPPYLSTSLMKRVGWIEGETLQIERRWADWRMERMPQLVDDLLHQGVEVIVTYSNESTGAAARATRTIPIVFINGFLPIECGWVDSYARPGRNATGLAELSGVETVSKRLEFLRASAPAARRLSVLYPDLSRFSVGGDPLDALLGQFSEAAKGLRFEVQFHMVRHIDDVAVALAEAAAAGAQAISCSGAYFNAAPAGVVAMALRHRWPSVTVDRPLFDAGLLMYYGPSQVESQAMLLRAFQMVDRILRGAKPAEIPVELPARYALALNLKAARSLGLTLPQSLLLRADEVIE